MIEERTSKRQRKISCRSQKALDIWKSNITAIKWPDGPVTRDRDEILIFRTRYSSKVSGTRSSDNTLNEMQRTVKGVTDEEVHKSIRNSRIISHLEWTK